jgi:hypothetical protein
LIGIQIIAFLHKSQITSIYTPPVRWFGEDQPKHRHPPTSGSQAGGLFPDLETHELGSSFMKGGMQRIGQEVYGFVFRIIHFAILWYTLDSMLSRPHAPHPSIQHRG